MSDEHVTDPDAGKTDCALVIAEVWTLLDGEVTEETRTRLQLHLDRCPACLAHYGLEKQTTVRPSTLAYPGTVLNAAAGTLELWVRVRFDPNAAVQDPASRGNLNRDLLTLHGGRDVLGLY